MAAKLYRLGRFAFDHRRIVLVGWIVALGLVVASAIGFSDAFSTKFEVPGTESKRAQNRLHDKFGIDHVTLQPETLQRPLVRMSR